MSLHPVWEWVPAAMESPDTSHGVRVYIDPQDCDPGPCRTPPTSAIYPWGRIPLDCVVRRLEGLLVDVV